MGGADSHHSTATPFTGVPTSTGWRRCATYDASVAITRSGARLWLLAFASFFLVHAAWAVAAPFNGPPDEKAHALRAAAVGHGEIVAENPRVQQVPHSLVPADYNCFPMKPTVPASCAGEPGGDETLGTQLAAASSYNPVYYVVAGWPVAIWPNWTGILLARLLTGAAVAGLLASAVVAACHWVRHPALLAGVLVSATPMLAHLGGAINPNGVEIAAGIGLFAGLIAMLRESEDRLNGAAVALVGVSASVLVTVRPLGVMWFGIALVATVIGSRRTHLRGLIRARAVRVWSAVVAVAIVAAFAWNAIATPLGISDGDHGLSAKQVLRFAVLDQWPNVANQLVGVTGFSELLQPRLIYVAWFMAAGVLILGGFAFGGRIEKFRTIFLFAATFLPLLAWELLRANASGWFSQGRYFLPAAVGLPLLGAYTLAHSRISREQFRSLTRTLTVLLVPIHLVVLAYSMTRWQSGLTSLNPLAGSWMPPLGPELPLATGALSVAVLMGMYWWASGLADESPNATHGAGATAEAPSGTPNAPRSRTRELGAFAVPDL
jgi:hypothetical protein